MENGLYRKAYRVWGGNPAGNPPDYDCCCEEVHDTGRSMLFHQCQKKRGYGPDQAYCKTHDPDAVKARRAKQEANWNAKWSARMLELYGKRFHAALVLIADGHNDARAVAREALSVLNKDK